MKEEKKTPWPSAEIIRARAIKTAQLHIKTGRVWACKTKITLWLIGAQSMAQSPRIKQQNPVVVTQKVPTTTKIALTRENQFVSWLSPGKPKTPKFLLCRAVRGWE